jgi:glycine betaine/choline ABC-type transport system substrate-binding protein
MGTYVPVQWLVRSPNITPLDYFLWGYLKTVVYENPPINLDDLKNKIIITCNEFTEDQIIGAIQRELLRRMEACVENNDNNFEQFME